MIIVLDSILGLAKVLFIVAILAFAAAIHSRLNKHTDHQPNATQSDEKSSLDATTIANKSAGPQIPDTSSLPKPTLQISNDNEVKSASTTEQEQSISTEQQELKAGGESTTITNASDTSERKVLDESWILNLNPTLFVIQYGASTNRSSLKTSTLQYGEQVGIFQYETTLAGSPVYGIAGGVFESRDAALAALKNNSDGIEGYDPWIRQAGDIALQIESSNR